MALCVEETKMVYLLLTRSDTCISRLIYHFTRGEFTHVSIGLEGPAGIFYSFARKDPRRPFPGGFIREQVGQGFFSLHPHIPCCLYAIPVSEDTYIELSVKLQMMYAAREDYHYNLLGVVTNYFRLPLVRRRHKFCSEFVAEMLRDSGVVALPQQPALTRPMDLSTLREARLIHRGEVCSLAWSVV